MSFFFFFWKYFIYSLGLKMRLKSNNFRQIYTFINI
jgi:hypothetical protein